MVEFIPGSDDHDDDDDYVDVDEAHWRRRRKDDDEALEVSSVYLLMDYEIHLCLLTLLHGRFEWLN